MPSVLFVKEGSHHISTVTECANWWHECRIWGVQSEGDLYKFRVACLESECNTCRTSPTITVFSPHKFIHLHCPNACPKSYAPLLYYPPVWIWNRLIDLESFTCHCLNLMFSIAQFQLPLVVFSALRFCFSVWEFQPWRWPTTSHLSLQVFPTM